MSAVVALTGSVASGKSTVARLMVEWGATLIDADDLVRQLQRPGEAVFDAIINRFGAGVVADDGTLNRPALRHLILYDPAARHDLEALVHPAVSVLRDQLIAQASSRGDRLVLVDIPLLFETGQDKEFNKIIVVDAPPMVRRNRLTGIRGIDPDEADRLMAIQQPSLIKRRRASIVIDNDGSIEELTARTREAWDSLTG